MMNRYLASVGIMVLLVVAAFGAFNYLVDPMLIFHHRGGDSETLDRVDQFRNMRLYKPIQVSQQQPDTIFIGSSRTGPLRPEHHGLEGARAYNFAVPGITINELNLSVRHAQAHQPLARLVIGIDYQAVVSPKPRQRPGFEQARMARSRSDLSSRPYLRQRFKDLQASLFSFDILAESITALAPAPEPRIRQFFADGAWRSITRQLTGRGGYIFSARNTVSTGVDMRFGADRNLPLLGEIMEFCYRNDIETRFFFTPTHVFVVDLWFRLASEELWRNTHREIVAMNERLAKQHGKPAFEIWGFGHEHTVTDEPIYYPKDIEQAYYDDGVHYRPKLAERLIDVLGDGQTNGFGQRLDSGNIDAYLDSIDALRVAFFRDNQALVRELHRSIAD